MGQNRLGGAWEASGPISKSLVTQWASERLKRRFTTGTMLLEESDPDVFAGLHTKWIRGQLHISPVFPDPWAAVVYQDKTAHALSLGAVGVPVHRGLRWFLVFCVGVGGE
ncbi:unnamed protein product [Polarella glacialis]|uniref:Uncharacterized protein n=1 Tax=Polarella glacialis TaxID=89957 RepID=A0A813GBQ2_POLGL|nr:unnamed protein product [Polarella glacialis]CAE8683529.1 unnamed protein product [Polarella glacialis]